MIEALKKAIETAAKAASQTKDPDEIHRLSQAALHFTQSLVSLLQQAEAQAAKYL